MVESNMYTAKELELLHEIWLKQHGNDYVISESDEKDYGKFYNTKSKYYSLTEQGYLYLKNKDLANAPAKKYGAPIPMEY